MTYYKNDPYWLNARFASLCPKCGKRIAKGDRIFYYPKGKTAYCQDCGEPESRSFQAAVQDEDFYMAQY